MRRLLSPTLGALLLAAVVFAGPHSTPKKTTLRCTLTGKTIEACCCEKREGKLYCPLAKKTIEKCCCETATAKKAKKG